MPTPHRDRQAAYRYWHPQLNLTFSDRHLWGEVVQACERQGVRPQDVRIAWAKQVLRATDTETLPPHQH